MKPTTAATFAVFSVVSEMASLTASNGGTSSSAANGPTPTFSSKSDLSTGAKAGIGVGTALVGLLLFGIVIAAFIYGKRSAKGRKKDEDKEKDVGNEYTFWKAELEMDNARNVITDGAIGNDGTGKGGDSGVVDIRERAFDAGREEEVRWQDESC